MGPLIGKEAELQSRSHQVGVDGLLLSESDAAARGLSLEKERKLTRISVAFGAEGGYRNVSSLLS